MTQHGHPFGVFGITLCGKRVSALPADERVSLANAHVTCLGCLIRRAVPRQTLPILADED